MKKFILLSLFAIGIMVLWPPGEQVRAATSDQVSFVAEHASFAPAMATVQAPAFVYEFNQLAPVAVVVPTQEKGGAAVEISLITSRDAGYLNKNVIATTTDFTMLKNYDFRICRLMKQTESQITAKNIESRTRCTIRADSQV